MLKTEEQHAHCKRSCYDDVTPINSGPPALYRLNTKRKYIDGNQKKVRRWTYGQKDENKPNKVILLVGETGTGKTTMINTMVNYLLGVKFEDEEFYQITEEIKEENKDEEEDQTESQTSEVTVYEVFVKEKPTSLTIIDTPGYGHTTPGYEGYEKDREVSKYLMELFSDKNGVNHIDAVCFVMKASQNRLSGKEHYIFHSVLSLFGKDIEENIVFLLTQSPGGPPKDALSAIKKAEIPCRKDTEGKPIFFLFNNQQKETRDKEYEQNYKLSWEMGEKSMNGFFTLMDENNRKSVQMTLTVLKKQTQLEACTSSLMERIVEKELKMKKLTEIQEAIKQNREKIEKCENFEFTVTKTFKEKVPIAWWRPSKATCCSVCQENCHSWSCWWANDPSECWVMEDGNCTVCTRKCHYSKHVKENKIYVMKTKDVINTFDDLKKEYECTDGRNLKNFDKTIFENTKTEHERSMQESESKSRVEDKLNRDLENIKKDKSKLVNDAYVNIKILCQTALKADSAFTLQHLDFLIPRLKEEGKDEWIKDLEDLQKAGEKQKNKSALNHLMGMTRQKCNQFFQYVTGQNQEIQ